jgi:phage virion morphogenesis protein
MTGARIVSALDDKSVLEALTRLRAVGTVNLPMMRAIGAGLRDVTQRRMSQGIDADGTPFAPLSAAYAAIKVGSHILIGRGMVGGLQGTLTFGATPGLVWVGSNKVYAAIHQFGGKIVPKNAKALQFKLGNHFVRVQSVTIPARPYLGFGEAERLIVLDEVERRIGLALRA